MDTKLHDAIVRICQRYEYPDELSRARVTKLVYLSDWEMALRHGRQLTGINWVFNHYGPYVLDVPATVGASEDLSETRTENAFGAPKVLITAVGSATEHLAPEEAAVVDGVLARTAPMTFTRFIDHVYDSMPIKRSERYDQLNLVRFAGAARREGLEF